MMSQKGISYKKIVVGKTYFDNYTYQFEIVPESLYKSSTAREQSSVLEELEVISAKFPQIFALNQEEYFTDVSEAFNRKPEKALKKWKDFQEAMRMMKQSGGTGGQKPVKSEKKVAKKPKEKELPTLT